MTGARRTRWLFGAVTLVFVLGVLMALLEVALRSRPSLFGQHLGNYVFSRYGTGPGEIYFQSPELDIRLMWPEFETRAYYNGYFWRHRTDARGFRNPPDRETDVLLLGDSLIYGHGAEPEDVVTEVLVRDFGRAAYDLSQQGDSLYQSYVKLRLYLEALHPSVVVVFAFLNDARDLEVYRSAEEIEAAPELTRSDWPALREAVARRGRAGGGSAGPCAWPSVRFPVGVWHELRARLQPGADPAADTFLTPLERPERLAPVARYYQRVLADLAARTRALGAELVVVHLDVVPEVDRAAVAAFRDMVLGAAEQAGAHAFDTGDALHCDGCALPDDGHLSARGHAVLAGLVDGWLREIEGGQDER